MLTDAERANIRPGDKILMEYTVTALSNTPGWISVSREVEPDLAPHTGLAVCKNWTSITKLIKDPTIKVGDDVIDKGGVDARWKIIVKAIVGEHLWIEQYYATGAPHHTIGLLKNYKKRGT